MYSSEFVRMRVYIYVYREEREEREREGERGKARERQTERGIYMSIVSMVVAIVGTRIPRLYQSLSSTLVPRFPDCTFAWQHSWYQESPIVPTLVDQHSPIVPMLGNIIGIKVPRLYQYLMPLCVPIVPGCLDVCCQCWYQDSPIVPTFGMLLHV